MRPCQNCGTALENQISVCPVCQASGGFHRTKSVPDHSPTATGSDHENRALFFDFMFLPLFAGVLFGGILCAAAGPWGIAVGVGVFLVGLMFRIAVDLV